MGYKDWRFPSIDLWRRSVLTDELLTYLQTPETPMNWPHISISIFLTWESREGIPLLKTQGCVDS